MALFEGYERRIDQISSLLKKYDMDNIEEAKQICTQKGLDIHDLVLQIQPIAFENACWAYTLGAAIAIIKDKKKASDIAVTLGEGLQAFCIPGSVADDRKVGIGHGNLASMLLKEETRCFAFLAGHESFAAAEGAIGLARAANKARKKPLQVVPQAAIDPLTEYVDFALPTAKPPCKMVDADNVKELVQLLQNEAKVI